MPSPQGHVHPLQLLRCGRPVAALGDSRKFSWPSLAIGISMLHGWDWEILGVAGSLSIETLCGVGMASFGKVFLGKKQKKLHPHIHPGFGPSVGQFGQCTHLLPVSILPTAEVVGLSEVLGSQTLRVMATKAPQMLCRSFFCWKGRSLLFDPLPSPPKKDKHSHKEVVEETLGVCSVGLSWSCLKKTWVPPGGSLPRGFLGRWMIFDDVPGLDAICRAVGCAATSRQDKQRGGQKCGVVITKLGGGFKYFSFSPLLGEMI